MVNRSTSIKPSFHRATRPINQPMGPDKDPAAQQPTQTISQLASTVKPAAVLPMHYQAQVASQIKPAATQPHFSGHQLVENDYTVTPDPDSSFNAYMASKTLRALMLRDLYKKEQGDPSHLKLRLNLCNNPLSRADWALADSLLLLDRPTDIIVDSNAGPAVIPALTMTRIAGMMNNATASAGKTFIGRNSNIRLGPIGLNSGGANRSIQIEREESNEDFQMRVALLMLATGETDRKKVEYDLSGSQAFNALQSLAYGEHGLVDAVLIGEKQVLTRAGLNNFYQAQDWTPEQIEEFNQDDLNLKKITNSPDSKAYIKSLYEFSPYSVVPKKALHSETRPSPYFSISSPTKRKTASTAQSSEELQKTDSDALVRIPTPMPSCENLTQIDSHGTSLAGRSSPRPLSGNKKPGLQVGSRLLKNADFNIQGSSKFLDTQILGSTDKPQQLEIQGAMPSNALLHDDTIYFNDSFDPETAAGVLEGLQALKHKKLQEDDPSHIKIMINSPGGETRSAVALTNELDSMGPVKTDVIVNGRAASCGAWLLASATGNKLATPQARIMIHQPSISTISGSTNTLSNQEADNLDSLNRKIAGVISEATGRNRDDVEEDLNQDTWMNPLEAMFYGDTKAQKGLLDGIIVGSNHAITREDVLDFLRTDEKIQAFLKEKPDVNGDVEKYLEKRLHMLRRPKARLDERDPFNDPIRTIMNVATRSGKTIDKIEQLKGSATRPWSNNEARTLDHFLVGRSKDFPADYWA